MVERRLSRDGNDVRGSAAMAQAVPEPPQHAGDGACRRLPHARRLPVDRQLATNRGEALPAGHRRALQKSGAKSGAAIRRNGPQGVATGTPAQAITPCGARGCGVLRTGASSPSSGGGTRTPDTRIMIPFRPFIALRQTCNSRLKRDLNRFLREVLVRFRRLSQVCRRAMKGLNRIIIRVSGVRVPPPLLVPSQALSRTVRG